MKKPHLFYLSPLLLAVVWLFTLPACQKDEPRTVHIKGRVTEYGTGKPIADARIYMLCDNSVVFGPSSSALADSLVADADGRFDRTYAEEELCGSLFLLPYKEGYFKGTIIALTTDFKELDIVLDPEAYLKVVTVPDGPNNYDHIGIGGDFRFETWASQDAKNSYFTARGNRDVIIRWGPFNNPDIKYPDTLFVAGHDTTTYTIHY